MKKILILAILFFSLPAVVLAEEVVGQVLVTQVQGDALILRDGAEIPISAGMACLKGDTLKTSETCQVDIVFNENAGSRLLGSTQAVIKATSPMESLFEITEGNALFNLKQLPAGSNFRVETPTAIAAVRGTQFWGRVDRKDPNNENITFAVAEGSVDIFAKSVNRTYHLEAKQALDIPRHVEKSPLVREAKREEMKAMKQAADIPTDSVQS